MTPTEIGAHWSTLAASMFPHGANVRSKIIRGACLIRCEWENESGGWQQATINVMPEAVEGYSRDVDRRHTRDSQLAIEVQKWLTAREGSDDPKRWTELLITPEFLNAF